MQELRYINLAGESVTFGASPPYILAHIEGTQGTSIDRKTVRGARQHGAQTTMALRSDRKLSLTINLFTLGRSEMYREREALCSLLSASKAFDEDSGQRARVVYTNNLGSWWTWAMPTGAPAWADRVKDIHPALKLGFECDSPYWFSMEESKGGFDVATEGFHFPLRFPLRFSSRSLSAILVCAGHTPTPVMITVQGEGEKPALINRTTGKELRLTTPIQQGSTLRISTDEDDLYVLLEKDGVQTNAYGLLDVTTPLSGFLLAPGENEIVYEAGGASAKTAITLRWHDRFEGV